VGALAVERYGTLCAAFIVNFALAWTFAVAFQCFSLVRENVGRLEGLWAAVKADTLSVAAFQVGLFGYMALYHLVIRGPPLSVASSGCWLMMEIGMIVGFFSAWPDERVADQPGLISRGWKETM